MVSEGREVDEDTVLPECRHPVTDRLFDIGGCPPERLPNCPPPRIQIRIASAKAVARISLPHLRTSAKRVTDPERMSAIISGIHRAISQPRLIRTVFCLVAPGEGETEPHGPPAVVVLPMTLQNIVSTG